MLRTQFVRGECTLSGWLCALVFCSCSESFMRFVCLFMLMFYHGGCMVLHTLQMPSIHMSIGRSVCICLPPLSLIFLSGSQRLQVPHSWCEVSETCKFGFSSVPCRLALTFSMWCRVASVLHCWAGALMLERHAKLDQDRSRHVK